jgi:hypothetical protein
MLFVGRFCRHSRQQAPADHQDFFRSVHVEKFVVGFFVQFLGVGAEFVLEYVKGYRFFTI